MTTTLNRTESGGEESESGGFENMSMIQCKTEHHCEHCENSNVYETLIMKCPKENNDRTPFHVMTFIKNYKFYTLRQCL